MSATLRTEVRPLDLRRLRPLIGAERSEVLVRKAAELRELLGRRRIVNVNSTATGGGVAELPATLIGYVRGAGIGAEWLVIAGEPDFFAVTKRIHNGLYGSPGDGGELGPRERAAYERTVAANIARICTEVRRGDVVLVHDPQPAGLIAPLVEHGAHVVWRCHVGYDGANEWTERAWAFVRPYVESAQAHVFSRESFAPAWIDRARLRAIPPSIDPFTPKNAPLEQREVVALLSAAGLLTVPDARPDPRVTRRAEVVRQGVPPHAHVPLVVQVWRWDHMKDMVGVLMGFVDHVDGPAHVGCRTLTSPPCRDPDGGPGRERAGGERASAPRQRRGSEEPGGGVRTHGRGSDVEVPAGRRKRCRRDRRPDRGRRDRPSATGHPHDLAGFGTAVERLLGDRAEATRLARNARSHIARHFLGDRHLLQYAELLTELLEDG